MVHEINHKGWNFFFNCLQKHVSCLLHFKCNHLKHSNQHLRNQFLKQSVRLCFSCLNVLFFRRLKLNSAVDCFFNQFTGLLTYTGCCENKYWHFCFAYFLRFCYHEPRMVDSLNYRVSRSEFM